ncbi:MAG: polysaccharide biosynthesis protein [Lachnospiraceae bacterium]|nr:polysaccharide biosynthesis protein [Lachnospiraceae bacterium]
MASDGRIEKMQKNIAWGTFSRIVVMIYSFVSRTFFIEYLGVANQGINGLFSNILTVLSFAELGIGTAMNFSLYKLVAEKNIPKIKAYMGFYKKAYRIIAAVVGGIGLCIMPFIPLMLTPQEINGAGGNIYIIYGLYLFNTVSSYFVSYKYSLSNAEQKGYIFTNINLIANLVCQTGQLIVLFVTKNFIFYCMVGAVVQLVQNLVTNWYMNRLYPYLKEKNVEKLSKEELAPIIKNVKALIVTKIGTICVNQTDNIIITAVINVSTVGIIDNYNTLLKNVNGFLAIVMNSQTASFGNLIALEGKERQYSLFKNFRFLTFWMHGFAAVVLFTLMTPFVVIWLGADKTTTTMVILLILFNYYLSGQRSCVYNVKVAGGLFEQDKWLAFATATVNLVVSIGLAKIIGLPGIYIGTVLQGLLETFVRPPIVYKHLFEKSSWEYYKTGLQYLGVVFLAGIVCVGFQQLLLPQEILALASGDSILSRLQAVGGRFVILAAIAVAVPNVIFYLFYHKREEFLYIKGIMQRFTRKIKKKK